MVTFTDQAAIIITSRHRTLKLESAHAVFPVT
jgi:hypothetical protein